MDGVAGLERIGRLANGRQPMVELHPHARNLFKAVSFPLWRSTRHNPVWMLQLVSPERLAALAQTRHSSRYTTSRGRFRCPLANGHLWFRAEQPARNRPLAYFSAEFGVHASLPIYSGASRPVGRPLQGSE